MLLVPDQGSKLRWEEEEKVERSTIATFEKTMNYFLEMSWG